MFSIDRDVAGRVHAGGDRPHDVLPVAGVDVVVHDDHPLGVHELPQVAPDAHHHALGVAGVGLLHRDHGDPVGAALGRQPEVDDLRELLAQQRDEHLVQRLAQHAGLVRRPAGEGGQVDRVLAHGDRADLEDRELLDRIVVAGVVAVGPLVGVVVEQDVALDARSRPGPAPSAARSWPGPARPWRRAAGRRTGTPTGCRAPASRRPGWCPGSAPITAQAGRGSRLALRPSSGGGAGRRRGGPASA